MAFPTWGNHSYALESPLQVLIAHSNTSSKCMPYTSPLTKNLTSVSVIGAYVSRL